MALDEATGINLSENNQPTRISLYVFISFVITFLVLGLSISISGPSVMFLEEIAYTWEDEIALIFTSRAVGSMGGWLTSYAFLEDALKHSGSLFGYGLFGLMIVNFGVAFTEHLWWLLMAFAFQGAFVIIAAQGCFAYVTKHSASPKHIHQFLVFVSLLGCALTPALFIPHSSASNLNNTTSGNVSRINYPVLQTISRPPRSLKGVESPAIDFNFSIQTTALPPVTFEHAALEHSMVKAPPSTFASVTTNFLSSTAPSNLTASLPQDNNLATNVISKKGNVAYSERSPSEPISAPKTSNDLLTTKLPDLTNNIGKQIESASAIGILEEWSPEKPVSMPSILFSKNISVAVVTEIPVRATQLINENPSSTMNTLPSKFDSNITTTFENALVTEMSSDSIVGNLTTVPPTSEDVNETITVNPFDSLNATTRLLANISGTPGKPDIVDAEHLNQDSNSADGSNTVARMKLADEDVRIAESKAKAAAEAEELAKPQVADASHQSKDLNTDRSSPADGQVNVKVPKLPPFIMPSIPPTEIQPEFQENDTALVSQPPPSTTPPLSPENVPVVILSPKTDIPSHIPERKLRSNDSYRLTSTYNSKWDTREPWSWQDEMMRLQYMKAVRYVYLSVGLLTVIAWFILLPLTGIIVYIRPFLECFTIQTSPLPITTSVNGQANQSVTNAISDNSVIRTDFDEESRAKEVSPADTESPPAQLVTKNVTWCAKDAESQTQVNPTLNVPNVAVLRSSRHNHPQIQRRNRRSSDIEAGNEAPDTPEQSVYLNYAPVPTVWPLVTWPSDFWILVATFLFSGLETTYGAFIHSFTLRTLYWTPVDALLVTMVFWIGDAIGRLCYICLGTSADLGISLLQNAVDFPSKDAGRPGLASFYQHNSRREKTFRIAALFIRTMGSSICLVCSSMLKEMTTSHLVCLSASDCSDNVIYESWSASRDKATWISTVGLGLGLGATAGSGLHIHQPRGYCLYLALLLGQLFVPAAAGYLTERVFHKNASETLGRTTLILSLLMFACLLIDLILQIVRRFHWWKVIIKCFSPFPEYPNSSQKAQSIDSSHQNSVMVTNESMSKKEEQPKTGWIQPAPSSVIPLEIRPTSNAL